MDRSIASTHCGLAGSGDVTELNASARMAQFCDGLDTYHARAVGLRSHAGARCRQRAAAPLISRCWPRARDAVNAGEPSGGPLDPVDSADRRNTLNKAFCRCFET